MHKGTADADFRTAQLSLRKLAHAIYRDFFRLLKKNHLVNVDWESRAIFLTIYDDLYKTYLWGTCITLNLFVALTAASESIYDVINMAAI